MPPQKPAEPWHSFLTALDAQISFRVYLHCLGGFVVTQFYGSTRHTSGLDVLTVVPKNKLPELLEKAGRNSALHNKFGVYLNKARPFNHPYGYDRRMIEMFPGVYEHLRLMALDPDDLVLAKIERVSSIDDDDVAWLGNAVPLDLNTLRNRYEQDRFPDEQDELTLNRWIERIEHERTRS